MVVSKQKEDDMKTLVDNVILNNAERKIAIKAITKRSEVIGSSKELAESKTYGEFNHYWNMVGDSRNLSSMFKKRNIR